MLVVIRTLFFASYRDLAGAPELEVELPEGATVGDLLAHLRARGQGLERLPGQTAVAVNRRYGQPSDLLEAGDEVALIPPVAGG